MMTLGSVCMTLLHRIRYLQGCDGTREQMGFEGSHRASRRQGWCPRAAPARPSATGSTPPAAATDAPWGRSRLCGPRASAAAAHRMPAGHDARLAAAACGAHLNDNGNDVHLAAAALVAHLSSRHLKPKRAQTVGDMSPSMPSA